MKQTTRLWHSMRQMGFSKCLFDDCMYRREDLWMLLNVDDIMLVGTDKAHMNVVKKERRNI